VKGFFFLFILLLFSCSQNKAETTNETDLSNKKTNPNTSNSDFENTNRIEKKYGIQWDFCDCVKKNDSIDRILKQQKLSDIELEKILDRANEIERKCKVLLTDLKSNKPSDRAKHQEKVKACLEK
jgi:hypothetical protein